MGNEQSQLPGVDIEGKAIEVSDFWSQHSANIVDCENITNLTVFIGELFVNGALWSLQTPLEKSSKNLMIYRHPCIIKYISSWQKNSKFYLAVEEVRPLSHILPTLNTLQICIGLHSILKALHFLHEKASASHNNVCMSSIYVTKDGSWKLGGMEYLCRYKDINGDYLSKTRTNRYSKAIDPNEQKFIQNERKDFIDIYAFGILACDILKLNNDDSIPMLLVFYEYCKTELQKPLLQRPKFSSILSHDLFNHEFITIHSFLLELPLKSDEEKTRFFKGLGGILKKFDELVVASQLSGLLLSRMVLLNKAAKENLLHLLLTPRSGREEQLDGLFSEDTFRIYLSPKLLEIISVRDAQIRLLLLHYFPKFMQTFTKEELLSCILPELLVGIKDTNDHLVAVTLRTLADLVPVLGATTVIGGKRAKLFNDGRPTTHSVRKSLRNLKRASIQHTSATPDILHDDMSISNLGVITNNLIELPERPRPDGEEGESTEEIEQSIDEDLENWEDWDLNEDNHNSNITNNIVENNIQLTQDMPDVIIHNMDESIVTENNGLRRNSVRSKRIIPDIAELDIKNQVDTSQSNDDFDFFQDMEPVIDSSNKFLIKENKCDITVDLDKEVSSKLALNTNDVHEEGWGDDDWE